MRMTLGRRTRINASKPMIIPDDVRKCVGFLAYKMADGQFRLAGTAWLFGRLIEGTERSFSFVVTAKHVIEGIRAKGLNRVYLRLNLKDRTSRWFETDLAEWCYHPTDASVDAAVLLGTVPEEADHLLYPLNRFVTEEIRATNGISIGDEVFLTGLFAPHFGQERNIPIIRVGNIAAMPEEPVRTRMGAMEAYLVEARSIGGLSGCPVFVHLGVVRPVGQQLKYAEGGPIFFLLGLMHGHWDIGAPDIDGNQDERDSLRVVNMGIAIVVPARKISEVLENPVLVERMAEADQKARARSQ